MRHRTKQAYVSAVEALLDRLCPLGPWDGERELHALYQAAMDLEVHLLLMHRRKGRGELTGSTSLQFMFWAQPGKEPALEPARSIFIECPAAGTSLGWTSGPDTRLLVRVACSTRDECEWLAAALPQLRRNTQVPDGAAHQVAIRLGADPSEWALPLHALDTHLQTDAGLPEQSRVFACPSLARMLAFLSSFL